MYMYVCMDLKRVYGLHINYFVLNSERITVICVCVIIDSYM